MTGTEDSIVNRPLSAVLGDWRRALGGLKSVPKVPGGILLVILVVAILSSWIAPHNATRTDLVARELPPAWTEDGSFTNLLGTDRQGRDILSRIIVGSRTSLSIAFLSILLGGLVGTALGLIAGYRGGWVDALIMRTVDVWLAIPGILIGLTLALTLGPGYWMVVTVLSIILWARYARLIRGDVLSWKQRDFVALARVAGASSTRIIFVHLLPNVLNSIVVLSTLQVGWAILAIASLSFLGVGVPPPTPSWGGMVSDGRNFIDTLWWMSIFPGIAIMLVVVSFNMLGDWLRDALDPSLRQL